MYSIFIKNVLYACTCTRAVQYIGISNYRSIELEAIPYFSW